MTPERWTRVQHLFDEAVARAPDDRDAYLARACGDDHELHAEVASLVAADTDPLAAILDAPAAALAAAVRPTERTGDGAVHGRVLGPYRLLRRIGRGGMGTVYLAEREDVGKQVALKLLREGRATPGSVRRFLAERRVLARLEHPNIAPLLDAGLTEDGTPYFAMEYVDGAPLVAACDARRMSVRERLALFTQVCDAVAYAHRNLVVHRDLKPSNVLVRADGTVRLLDFGIAKLLSAAAGGDAPPGPPDAATADGQTSGAWLMTPRYAAPEQRRGGPVTPATDVYALGLLLHELVSGERPPVHLPSLAALDAAAAPTLHTEHGTTTSASTVAEVAWQPEGSDDAPGVREERARARGTTAARLRRALAGDIAAIVRHATQEAPALRYATAEGLGDDLRRHLARLPVRARPAGRAYRAALFVRRNRWGVAAAGALVALLAGTSAVTAVQQARTRVALAQAREEAAKARQVTNFVSALFEDVDPFRTGRAPGAARSAVADGILGAGAERLEHELASQPAIRAELLRTLGVVARNLGRPEAADTLLRRGLATRRQLLGTRAGPDAELGGLLHELGVVLRTKGDFAGADSLLTQALVIRSAVPGAGGADLTATRFQLGVLRRYQGRFAEAERLIATTLPAQQRGAGGPALADAYDALANVRYGMHDPDSAVALTRRAVHIRERWYGPDHPLVARGYVLMGAGLNAAGQREAAERVIRYALTIFGRHLAPDHPEVARAQSELAWVLMNQRVRYAEAEGLQRRALAARQRANPDGSRDVAGSMYSLGVIRYRRGALDEAADLMRRAAAMRLRLSGPDDEDVVAEQQLLAVVEALRGDEGAALAVAGRVLRARHVAADEALATRLATLAEWLREEGRCDRATPLYRKAAAAHRTRASAGSDAAALAAVRAGLAACAPPPAVGVR